MTDQFTEAVEEMEEKSHFVCVSCGHPHKIAKGSGRTAAAPGESLHDRFSEAVKESGEKSAFVCESCGHRQPIPTSSRH
jgi:rubrerythrin